MGGGSFTTTLGGGGGTTTILGGGGGSITMRPCDQAEPSVKLSTINTENIPKINLFIFSSLKRKYSGGLSPRYSLFNDLKLHSPVLLTTFLSRVVATGFRFSVTFSLHPIF